MSIALLTFVSFLMLGLLMWAVLKLGEDKN